MSFCSEIEKMRSDHRGLAKKIVAGESLTAGEAMRKAQLAPDPAFNGLLAHYKKELADVE